MRPARPRSFGLPLVVGVVVLAVAGVDLSALAALLAIGAIPVVAFATMFGAKKLAESAAAVLIFGVVIATVWMGFSGWAQTAAGDLVNVPMQVPPGAFGLLLLGLLGLLAVGVLLFVTKLRRALPPPAKRPRPRARDRIVLADLDSGRDRRRAAPRGHSGDELDLLGDGDGAA